MKTIAPAKPAASVHGGTVARAMKALAMRLAGLASLTVSIGHAHDSSPEMTSLPEVVVTAGVDDNLLGVADSAAEGTVGSAQLARRPLLRSGELLETVPGLIVTQHSGAGKANQYFLRGFNLDHGTDFATTLGGMPVNLPSHGHGQGYADLNFIIPELVSTIDYRKGPYHAGAGDFSSAGAAEMAYATHLPQNLARVTAGGFGYDRELFAASPSVGSGHLLYAVEVQHHDGPWEHPDNSNKINGVLRYSQGDGILGCSLTAMGYRGVWDSTDQVARRAVDDGMIGRFGTLDPTTGGDSQRYSLQGEWHRRDADSVTQLSAYGFYYDLDLFSDFTYFLHDPVNGDQFEQQDRRGVGGLQASHTLHHELAGKPAVTTFGLQARGDSIDNGLFNTNARQRLSTVREDEIWQTSLSPYLENRVRWTETFRTVAGLRADLYHFDVNSDNPANSGDADAAIASPKMNLIFGPWAGTEVYVSGGLGFHSNDARGVTTRVNPVTGAAVSPADPLVRTKGAEAGLRTAWLPGLQSTLSFWMLDIDSELLFAGDAGTTEASRPSRRHGVELSNFYHATKWLTVDADLSLSQARFRDEDLAGDHIPGSTEAVLATGISVHDLNGFFGELRLRYFGPRALIEDDSVRSSASILLNARAGCELTKRWTVAIEVFNLLDTKANDIEYYYTSRLAGEPAAGVDDRHFHPAEPRSLRVSMTARF